MYVSKIDWVLYAGSALMKFDLPVASLAAIAHVRFLEKPKKIAAIAENPVHAMMMGRRP